MADDEFVPDFPSEIHTRIVRFGGVVSTEGGKPLSLRADTIAVRPATEGGTIDPDDASTYVRVGLIWAATGARVESVGRGARTPVPGEMAWFEVAVTDQNGWIEARTRKLIVLDGTEQSHAYITTLTVMDGADTAARYVYGPYGVPSGGSPLDGDLMLGDDDPTFGIPATLSEAASALVASRGTANGLAPLDGSSRVPDANLPDRLSDVALTGKIGAVAGEQAATPGTPLANGIAVAAAVGSQPRLSARAKEREIRPGSRTIFAPDMYASTGAPTLSVGSDNNSYPARWVMSGTVQASIAGVTDVPDDWAFVDVDILWTVEAAATGDVRFAGQLSRIVVGDNLSSPDITTGVNSVTTVPATPGVLVRTPFATAVQITPGVPLRFELFRTAANAADTSQDAISVVAFVIRPTARPDTPAASTQRPVSRVGENVRLDVPASFKPNRRTPLVMMFHGSNQDENAHMDNAWFNGLREDGWAIVGANAHGQNWGAPRSIQDMLDAYAIANRYLATDRVMFIGSSHGGMLALNTLRKLRLPVVGVYLAQPAINLAERWARGTPETTDIKNSYGFTSNADYAFYTAGYDPMLARVAEYPEIRYRFVASEDDTLVMPAANTHMMRTKLEAAATVENSLLVATGAHGSASHYNATDLRDFGRRCLS